MAKREQIRGQNFGKSKGKEISFSDLLWQKTAMKTFLIAASFLFALSTQAALAETYDCQAMLVAADIPAGAEWKFQAEALSEDSHGGKAQVFRAGAHEIEVMANRQWLGVSWVKDGKKIAEGVFVLGNADETQNRVAILYDPSDSGDQVSLGCDRAN